MFGSLIYPGVTAEGAAPFGASAQGVEFATGQSLIHAVQPVNRVDEPETRDEPDTLISNFTQRSYCECVFGDRGMSDLVATRAKLFRFLPRSRRKPRS